jgi:hypothetical protein
MYVDLPESKSARSDPCESVLWNFRSESDGGTCEPMTKLFSSAEIAGASLLIRGPAAPEVADVKVLLKVATPLVNLRAGCARKDG